MHSFWELSARSSTAKPPRSDAQGFVVREKPHLLKMTCVFWDTATVNYAWKAIIERLLTDELSADYDSVVSTSEPPATNGSSFRFESPPGQDVSRHSNESSGWYILLEFCSFSVTTCARLSSKDSFSETYNCYTSHWLIICLSFKSGDLSTVSQLRSIRTIEGYNRTSSSISMWDHQLSHFSADRSI